MQVRQAGGQRVPQAPRVLAISGHAWPDIAGQLIETDALIWSAEDAMLACASLRRSGDQAPHESRRRQKRIASVSFYDAGT
jgi:hypothetical protein